MYKKLFIKKKAVCFDLDDTLIKTSPLWDAAIGAVCEGVGLTWPGFEGFAGVRLEIVWDKIIADEPYSKPTLTVAELVDKTQQKFLQLVAESEIEESAGFWSLAYELKEEKGFKLALVSNSQRRIVESILSRIGISQTFDAIVCGDDVRKSKPDPEMYRTVAKMLGVRTRDMVAFEDSPTGAKSAVDAGCTTIVIYDGTFFESDYPKQIATMVSGFDDVAGRMDLTFRETIEKTGKLLQEEQTEKQTKES